MRRLALLTLALALGSCGGESVQSTLPPLGQVLLYVDTDAPLPAAAGEVLGPDDPLPLFDRVRIQVYRPGEDVPCTDCTHEFDLDRRIVGEGRASVGLRPPPDVSGYVARVRLFRSGDVELGEPRVDATVDLTISLPLVHAEGITPVTVVLKTDDVARPLGSRAEPIAPVAGAPRGGLVGTWPPAKRTTCPQPPALPGEVCVPGGAFWMGNPNIAWELASKLRLVTLSPFFLDEKEVTVGAFRPSGLAIKNDPFVSTGSNAVLNNCAYTSQVGNNETLPLNCVSWETARAFCQARGADLPTEAQFHYAASGLGKAPFVWGADAPSCEDAVYARFPGISPSLKCPGSFAEIAGRGARDRLVLRTGTILDLAGNMSEHALDVWNLPTEDCWGSGVFADPVCDESRATPHAIVAHTVVGGSYMSGATQLMAAWRDEGVSYGLAISPGAAQAGAAGRIIATGFRCARPGGG